MASQLEPRGLFSQPPPEPRTRDANNPTLLYSWWCTIFAAVIIIVRLCGRKTRSNMLFKEDWIMMAAIIPLLIRMAFIHVVLLYGTNNVQTVGVHYTETELDHREVGAKLVLAGRIFYAMFIWTSKLTISEFLKRITGRIWKRSYEITLRGIRIFLLVTFGIVVIATLCECQPFDHYWQVRPDPGPHCRQGYANLIAMGTCDILTDLVLIAFPIPIIIRSGQTWKRKFQLASLFSLSIILIIVTALRVPKVIGVRGRQQYRTVWASSEILASAAVSNAVILGSFLRDKGTKKNKYKASSISDSIDAGSARRPTITALQNTGSDEDLFRFLGIRVPDHLQHEPEQFVPRPAPPALPASVTPGGSVAQAPPTREEDSTVTGDGNSSNSDDSLRKPPESEPRRPSPVPSSKRGVTFFDVGGLLEDGSRPSRSSESRSTTLANSSHSAIGTTIYSHDFATTPPSQSRRGSQAQDVAPPSTPSQSRRPSRNASMLQDVGGLLTPSTSHASSGMDRYYGRRQSDSHLYPPSRHARPAPAGVLGPTLERHETQTSLQDPGGLLGYIPEIDSAALRRVLDDGPPGPSPGRRRPESDTTALRRVLDEGPPGSQGRMPETDTAALRRLLDEGPPGSQRRLPETHTSALRRVLDEGPPGPPPPRRQARHRPSSEQESLELEDIGGLLSPQHEPDASAAALQQTRERTGRASAPSRAPAPSSTRGGSDWDGLDIHDPGGLLSK